MFIPYDSHNKHVTYKGLVNGNSEFSVRWEVNLLTICICHVF